MNQIAAHAETQSMGASDRWLRARLLDQFSGLQAGALQLTDSLGTVTCGAAMPGASPVRVQVVDPAFYRMIAASGTVGAGEAYMEGLWTCDDLVGLVRLLVRNRALLDGLETGLARAGGMALRGCNALRRNTRTGSRRNIAAHYDLGNDFFSLFLSPDLMYSSALYANADDTLEIASTRKLDRICQTLELSPEDRVIEIGTGWGGFALHAAQHYGCHVTTTTISQEQHALASQRIAEAGLQDRVTLLLQDYRDLEGTYDKLVSIEMVEAIGAQYLETYFAKLGTLLAPDGAALVQAITIEDHRYVQARDSVDFIKRFIFPGSFIPSVAAMLQAKTRASDLQLENLEDFGMSYAKTLSTWRERFMARRTEVRAQGFDARFMRMWEFYLAYCEGGFRERSIGVVQMLLGKPGHRRAAMPQLPGRVASRDAAMPA